MTKLVQIPLEAYHESLEQGMEAFIKELKTVIEIKQVESGPFKGRYHLRLIVCLSEEIADSKTKAA